MSVYRQSVPVVCIQAWSVQASIFACTDLLNICTDVICIRCMYTDVICIQTSVYRHSGEIRGIWRKMLIFTHFSLTSWGKFVGFGGNCSFLHIFPSHPEGNSWDLEGFAHFWHIFPSHREGNSWDLEGIAHFYTFFPRIVREIRGIWRELLIFTHFSLTSWGKFVGFGGNCSFLHIFPHIARVIRRI